MHLGLNRVSRSFNTEDAEFTDERICAMKHRCPICKAETDSAVHADFPFCSERCRMRDLGNWASEKYVVSEPVFDEEAAAEGEDKTILLDLKKTDANES
jgi:uncharacterized protein